MIDKWFKKNHIERMTDEVSLQAILKMVSNMKGELTQLVKLAVGVGAPGGRRMLVFPRSGPVHDQIWGWRCLCCRGVDRGILRRTGPLSRTKNLWDKTKTLKLQAGGSMTFGH